jgi:hypothetical protein
MTEHELFDIEEHDKDIWNAAIETAAKLMDNACGIDGEDIRRLKK